MSKEVVVQVQPASMPSATDWALMKEQANYAIKSGFLPSAIKTPEQAITIALKGRELGIPMMQAFSHIHVIQGKPSCSAELQLALIFRNCPGAIVDYVETSPKACRIKAARPGRPLQEFCYTIEEAGTAKLLGKEPWKAYPAAMLRARCVSIVARALFPDAIAGMSYTPEELGADVNEEGEVTSLPPPQVFPEQPAEGDGIQDPNAERYKSAPKNTEAANKKSARKEPTPAERERTGAIAKMMASYREFGSTHPDTSLGDLIRSRYQKMEVRELTVEQIGDLTEFMQHEATEAVAAGGDFNRWGG